MDRSSLMAAMQATAASVKPEPVDVPKWGRVYVKALTVAEVDENSDADAKSQDKSRLARGAARVMVDETGSRLFDPMNQADIDLLSSQPWALLQLVIAKANTFNGMSAEGQEEAGNV